MSAEISEDVEVRVATETAQNFVESYYTALNIPHRRSTITTDYYLKATPTDKVDLSFNGKVLEDRSALQEFLNNNVQKCLYEVQGYDCQVINTNYSIAVPPGLPTGDKGGKRMTILVLVSGSVKYWGEDTGEATLHGFTDNVLLVPNWESMGSKGNKNARKWLIQNQTFRVVS